MNGFVPAAGSPLRDGRLVTEDAYFQAAPHIGAFRDASDVLTQGWTFGIPR